MKSPTALLFRVIVATLLFSACDSNDADPVPSKAEQNAQLLARTLEQNQGTLRFVKIYEQNPQTGTWILAADSQRHVEGEDFFWVDGPHFFLDGSGTKQYPTEATPSHQLSGYYYFDLAYLVSFEMDTPKEFLFLYFKY